MGQQDEKTRKKLTTCIYLIYLSDRKTQGTSFSALSLFIEIDGTGLVGTEYINKVTQNPVFYSLFLQFPNWLSTFLWSQASISLTNQRKGFIQIYFGWTNHCLAIAGRLAAVETGEKILIINLCLRQPASQPASHMYCLKPVVQEHIVALILTDTCDNFKTLSFQFSETILGPGISLYLHHEDMGHP